MNIFKNLLFVCVVVGVLRMSMKLMVGQFDCALL